MRATQKNEPSGYAPLQVWLHWAVVALVVVQWIAAGSMGDFVEAHEAAGPPGFPDRPLAVVHALSGASILVLMLVRLAARLRYGAPPLPADMPAPLRLLARLNHYAFYAVLIAMPPTGVTALFIATEAGDVHSALKNLLILLVALHLSGAAFHAFIRRDGIVRRMLPVRRRA